MLPYFLFIPSYIFSIIYLIYTFLHLLLLLQFQLFISLVWTRVRSYPKPLDMLSDQYPKNKNETSVKQKPTTLIFKLIKNSYCISNKIHTEQSTHIK